MKELNTLAVLIVEDFALTRKVQAHTLKELGVTRIIEADNGASALEKMEQHPDIGLIISDWNMPVMDGFQLLVKVRSHSRFGRTPFIMATAQGELRQMQKARDAGADDIITKPFTADELGTAIEAVLNLSPEAAPLLKPKKSPSLKSPERVTLRVAHIQITDHLILGILKHRIDSGEVTPRYFELATVSMPGWNPLQQSMQQGSVDAAFILAPLAMDLFSVGTPIRLVLYTHKNGSISVQGRQDSEGVPLHDAFKSGTFFLPHTMSVHHMLSDMFFREIGLTLGPAGDPGASVFFEVAPPVKMPGYLSGAPGAKGFTVAEPFGSLAIRKGIGDRLFLSGDFWENHPCCVLAMQDDFIDDNRDAVYEFVQMLVEAGHFIARKPETSARIAREFLDPGGNLGLTRSLLHDILTEPSGIRTDDLFPVTADLDRMQRYMHEKMGIGTLIDLEKFVDTRFAEAACLSISGFRRPSVLHSASGIVTGVTRRQPAFRATPSPSEYEKPFESHVEDASVSFTFVSDMVWVDRLIQEAKGFLRQLGIEAFSGFSLILRELLINAVEHGNRSSPAKKVTCSVTRINESLFKIKVCDEGSGFDHRSLDLALPQDTRQLRKRGYPFIRAFSEKIEFNDKGNEVTVYHSSYRETRFELEIDGRQAVIRPSGDITAASTARLGALLKEQVNKGVTRFRFDFTLVQDVDSVGLSAFIVLKKMLDGSENKHLEIIHAGREITDLFRMINLDVSYRMEGNQP